MHTLASLTRAYSAIKVDSARRQIGMRCLKAAKQFQTSNPEYAAAQLAKAASHLPYAQERARLSISESLEAKLEDGLFWSDALGKFVTIPSD